MMHDNSIMAYSEIKPELTGRRRNVYLALKGYSRKCTDREIKEIMGMGDMNAVRPRITELIKLGYIEEVGSIKCPVTNKTVRQVMIINEGQMTLF
jgi:predicted transcriptional regulator